MFRRISALLAFLILPISLVASPSDWMEVHSDHFVVLTDAGDKQGEQVALRFEQMRAAFESMFNRVRVNMPLPLEVVAFRSTEEFRQYSPLWKGKPIDMTGFFEGSDDRNYIGIDLSSADPYGTAFHEYSHLLLHGNFPTMPLWFDEGFAEYFSSLNFTGKMMTLGQVPAPLQQVLSASQWLPVTELFGVQRDSNTYNEGNHRSIFYAESWLAVHYIMGNNRLADAFNYLHLTQIEHVPVATAIQQAFVVDPNAFEKILRDYSNHEKVLEAPAPAMHGPTYRTAKLSALNAHAILADVHAHSRDFQQQAFQEFQEILKQSPENLIANRGLGYLCLQQGEYDQATALFQKASLADDQDARLHYLVALLMNRQAIKEGKAPQQPSLMRTELQKAIELDPDMADAHNLLAFAWAAEGKYDAAISEQMKAIQLDPSADIYQANLAHWYLQVQEWDKAKAILERLQTSSNPEVKQNAVQNLANLQSAQNLAEQNARARKLAKEDPTLPQWKATGNLGQAVDDQTPAETKPDTRKVVYTYGLLESVDCSSAPAAVLTVRKGPKTMKLRTEDYKRLVLMGADEFSCNWRNRKILVNYKPGGNTDGDIVTLELQAGN